MKEKLFRCTAEWREKILMALREALEARQEVVFAYVYGSFLEDRPFHDIDIGVYFQEYIAQVAKLSIDLAFELEDALMRSLCRFPVDVRVLNGAPVSFCYHVLRGRLLFCRDEEMRVRWAERIISRYLDLKPLRYRALKEAMISWGSTGI